MPKQRKTTPKNVKGFYRYRDKKGHFTKKGRRGARRERGFISLATRRPISVADLAALENYGKALDAIAEEPNKFGKELIRSRYASLIDWVTRHEFEEEFDFEEEDEEFFEDLQEAAQAPSARLVRNSGLSYLQTRRKTNKMKARKRKAARPVRKIKRARRRRG